MEMEPLSQPLSQWTVIQCNLLLQASGFNCVVDEISEMIVKAKRAAGIDEDTPLESLVSLTAWLLLARA